VRVLVVEDQQLIALEIAAMLEELGHEVVGPFGGLEQAEEAVAQGDFDMAVLDINLEGAFIFPLAEQLVQRGVPFVLSSGYDDLTRFPDSLQAAPRIEKPYGMNSLSAALSKAHAAWSMTERPPVPTPG
jgi:DNA-binding NtrC family response regulator